MNNSVNSFQSWHGWDWRPRARGGDAVQPHGPRPPEQPTGACTPGWRGNGYGAAGETTHGTTHMAHYFHDTLRAWHITHMKHYIHDIMVL